MEETKYLLFEANFDEGESELYKLSTFESLSEFFCGDMNILTPLLDSGSYYDEWFQYHLIDLSDYN